MRLIDADVLVKHKVTGEIGNLSGDFVPGFAIANAPTIEAEPVRHGRWEWYEEWGPSTWLEPPDIINEGWKCTECGIDLGEYLTAKLHEEVYVGDMDKMPEVDRCPNCGAKMDKKEETACD